MLLELFVDDKGRRSCRKKDREMGDSRMGEKSRISNRECPPSERKRRTVLEVIRYLN